VEPGDRLAEIIQKLRKKGSRLTPQRLAVLKTLVSDSSHPSVEDVYAAVRRDFPMTSLATVYKTISLMKEMDEVKEVRGGDRAVRYDGSASPPHAHVLCLKCSQVVDFDYPALDALPKVVENDLGFKVQRYSVEIFGLCPECRKQ
jgi:Fur family peroxide stress response transcriptional regulator